MSDPVPGFPADVSRREALASAILLVAGVAMGPAACSRPLARGFLSNGEIKILAPVCETILPQTDTPGALAANVHGFIDGMMTTWASEATRRDTRALLQRVDDAAQGRFVTLTQARQTEFIERFDAAAFAAKDKAWAQFKKLVLLGFYTSEVGATEELAYLPVPGDWRPDIPLTPDMRTWAE